MNGVQPDIYVADDWIMLRNLNHTDVSALATAAKAQEMWQEIVPGLDSLALAYNPQKINAGTAYAKARALEKPDTWVKITPPPPVTLPICYDAVFGPDQAFVADRLGIALKNLSEWHMAQDYSVAMIGFLPGFAYLHAHFELPDIPRLPNPRSQIAPGSVGLLGQQCGIYPMSSPGGWPLIGRVAARLFDASRSNPALLTMGQAVRFCSVNRKEFADLTS